MWFLCPVLSMCLLHVALMTHIGGPAAHMWVLMARKTFVCLWICSAQANERYIVLWCVNHTGLFLLVETSGGLNYWTYGGNTGGSVYALCMVDNWWECECNWITEKCPFEAKRLVPFKREKLFWKRGDSGSFVMLMSSWKCWVGFVDFLNNGTGPLKVECS